MRRHRNKRGLTLIEAVTSIVVLGIALPPLVALFTEVAMHSPDHTYQVVARTYANNLMEEIASKAFEDPDVASGSFGTEEGPRSAYDDVDDYDGLSNSPPRHLDGGPLDEYGGFTRSVAVTNTTAADPDPTVPEPDGTTDIKRVEVTVAWTGARGGELTLSTLRSRPGEPGSYGSLDEMASQATAARTSKKKFEIDLVSISPLDLVITSFSLSSDIGTEELHRLRLDNEEIWHEHDIDLPTGTVNLNEGTISERTISVYASPPLTVEFKDNQSGTVQYTLVLNFSDGSSSTLTFTIDW